jgi:hypothetical protein
MAHPSHEAESAESATGRQTALVRNDPEVHRLTRPGMPRCGAGPPVFTVERSALWWAMISPTPAAQVTTVRSEGNQ